MIFEARVPSCSDVGNLVYAERFDHYLRSRIRYKRELIEELATSASPGPVLEANDGFGGIGAELLRLVDVDLYCVNDEPWGMLLCERDFWERGLRCQSLSWRCGMSLLPSGYFTLVYSVNRLHEWEEPEARLTELYRVVRKGGTLIVNDLKRDADPYITEYVIREMAENTTDEGHFRAQLFSMSLRSSYSVNEIAGLLERARLGPYELDEREAMTVTLRMRK